MTPLTPAEREALVVSLQMRVAFIETGNPVLRASDVAAGHRGEVKALSSDQMRLVLLSEDMLKKIYNGEICWR